MAVGGQRVAASLYNAIIVHPCNSVVLMMRYSSFCVITHIFADIYKIFVLYDLEMLCPSRLLFKSNFWYS